MSDIYQQAQSVAECAAEAAANSKKVKRMAASKRFAFVWEAAQQAIIDELDCNMDNDIASDAAFDALSGTGLKF